MKQLLILINETVKVSYKLKQATYFYEKYQYEYFNTG